MILSRRGIIGVLAGLVATPAIVKFDSLMPVRVLRPFNPLRIALFGPDGNELTSFGRVPLTSGESVSFPMCTQTCTVIGARIFGLDDREMTRFSNDRDYNLMVGDHMNVTWTRGIT